MENEIYTIVKNSKSSTMCPICGKWSRIFKSANNELMCNDCFKKKNLLTNFDKEIEKAKKNRINRN